MQLTPKEQALVDSVIQKIKGFDSQAIVEVADDTLEHPTFKGLWQRMENFSVTTTVSKA